MKYPRPWFLAARPMVLRACLLCLVACEVACERPSVSRQPATRPATGPSVASDPEAYQVKLAALRELVEEQPVDADRRTYAAYVIKDAPDDARSLADALAATFVGRGPRVVAGHEIELYTRKGRTMDAASGRPVKVFQVRLAEARAGAVASTGDAAAIPRAEARASWQSGRLAGETRHYRLARGADGWQVVERPGSR